MNRLEKLSTYIFPSDPNIGKIGSIDLVIWMAQICGVPILGIKKETLALKIILVLHGITTIAITNLAYTAFEVYDLILNWNNMDIFTQNVCLLLSHFAGILKILNIFYHLSDVHKIIVTLKLATQKYVVSPNQHRAFFRGELENNIPLMIYIAVVFSTCSLAVGVLFYNSEGVAGKIFPFRVKLPSWIPFKLQLVYIGISLTVFALQVIAIDFLNVTLMNLIRFEIIVLNLSFDELTFTAEHKTSENPYLKLMVNPNEKITSIVKHHCILIELRDQVENVYRLPVLIQFVTSLLIAAITGFQATVRSGASNGDLLIYFYCGCIFSQLFVYCWFGNEVFEQSKTLATSGYNSSWYAFDQRAKKKLQIFLTNAQRPFLFTAGGFMGLTLASFAGILSKSYSFIAVLRQMYAH